MPSLGSFSYDLTLNSQQALQSLQAVQTQAAQTAAALNQINGKQVTVNTSQAQAALTQVNAAAQALKTQGSIEISIRADTGSSAQDLQNITALARSLGANPTISLQVKADDAQASAAFQRVQQNIQRVSAGERLNIAITGTAQQFEQTLARLQNDIKAAEARGAHIAVSLDTKQATSQLAEFQKQLGQGLGFGSGAVIAAQAIQAIGSAAKAAVQIGVEYNANLEQTINTLEHYTGSTEKAQQALAAFRKIATESPFKEQQVVSVGQSFIRTTGGDVERAKELTELTIALGAAHPELPFDRIHGAVLQLISGDYRAFEDSTQSTFGSVAKLAATGVSGMELYRKAVEAAGGSTELLAKNSATFTARLTTLQSSVDKLLGSLTKGGFDEVSGDIAKTNENLQKNAEGYNAVAAAAGRAAAEVLKIAAITSPPGQIATAASGITDFLAKRAQDQVEASRTPVERQANTAKVLQTDAIATNTGAIAGQTQALKNVETEAKAITDAYEAATHPLQAQLAVIDQLYQADDRRLQKAQALNAVEIAHLNQRAELAQAPPEIRADVAGSEASIQIQQRQLDITNKRKDISISIGNAEVAVANDVAQAQIRGAERGLQAQQRAVQAAQAARQEEIANIQEVQRANQQARTDEIQGIQEAIQARRQGYGDERDAIRETQRAAEERWSNEERAAARTQERVQQGYQAQIARLQEINRVANLAANVPSAAERQLVALDESERRYQMRRSLSSAQDAVKNANTPAEKKSAERNLQELKHEQDVANKRYALEAKIKAEKEAEDKARLAREEQIRLLQVKAQQEAAQYQKEKEARDDAHAIFLENQAAENRKADKEEHDKERSEDLQIKAAEKTDRDLARSEAEGLRATQKADREASKAEAAGLLSAQLSIEAQNNKLADEAAKRQLNADQEHLKRLEESAPLEATRLTNLQTILDNENNEEIVRLARESSLAQSTKEHLENVQKIRDAEKEVAGLDYVTTLRELKTAEELRLVPVLAIKDATVATLNALEATKILLTGSGTPRQLQGPPAPTLPDGLEGPPAPRIGNEGFEPPAAVAATPNQNLQPGGTLFGIHIPTADEIKTVADGIIGGLSGGLTAGLQTLTDATNLLIATGVIKTAVDLLRIGSPSKLFEEFGKDTAQGFANGFPLVDLAAVVSTPFNAMTGDGGVIPTFVAAMGSAGTNSATGFQTNYEALNLGVIINSPFDAEVTTNLPNFVDAMGKAGTNSAAGFIAGFKAKDLPNVLYREGVYDVIKEFQGGYQSWFNTGANSAQSFVNGFGWVLSNWKPFGSSSSSGSGDDPPEQRAVGGPLNVGRMTMVGERGPELIVPRNAGNVLPADVTSNLLALASGGGPTAGGGGSNVQVTNNFNISQNTGESMDALADRIISKSVETTIWHLDQAHRNQSERVSKVQSGAD